MKTRNHMLFLRNLYKSQWFYRFYNLFLKLRKKPTISFFVKSNKFKLYFELKKILKLFFSKVKNFSKDQKVFIKMYFIKCANSILKFNLKLKFNTKTKMSYNVIKKFCSSNIFINKNTKFLFSKKNKLLKFVLNKLLKKQVLVSSLLLDRFLGLSLHSLFLRRFRFHFLEDLNKIKFKSKFNLNNYFFGFNFKI